MDLRKVQLTGGSSLTVTLPKSWTERTKTKPGDVVGFVEQPDGSLAVHSKIHGERKLVEYTIEVEDGEPNYLFRKIVAAYLMGYDVLHLHSQRPLTVDQRQTIRQAVRRIVGLEIVDEQPSSIAVQDFLDPREFHMEKAVRRMGILTAAMQEEAVRALRNPRPDVPRSEEERDVEVDRLYWLVTKQYHAILRDSNYATKMGLTASQALNFLLVARVLERAADHADRIAHEAVLLGGAKIPAATLERTQRQGHRAVEIFQRALQTFLRRDAKGANAVIEDAERLIDTQKKLLRDVSDLGGEIVSHLAFIIESIGRTAAYAADVGEVAINHKVATA